MLKFGGNFHSNVLIDPHKVRRNRNWVTAAILEFGSFWLYISSKASDRNDSFMSKIKRFVHMYVGNEYFKRLRHSNIQNVPVATGHRDFIVKYIDIAIQN